ncbi:unnamed protein product, partial [Symbiodinium pilosum]
MSPNPAKPLQEDTYNKNKPFKYWVEKSVTASLSQHQLLRQQEAVKFEQDVPVDGNEVTLGRDVAFDLSGFDAKMANPQDVAVLFEKALRTRSTRVADAMGRLELIPAEKRTENVKKQETLKKEYKLAKRKALESVNLESRARAAAPKKKAVTNLDLLVFDWFNRLQMDTAANVVRFAQAIEKEQPYLLKGIRKISVLSLPHAETGLHKIIRDWGLSLPLDLYYFNKGILFAPMIKPKAWLEYLLCNKPGILLGGFSTDHFALPSFLESFWQAYKFEDGDHEVFQRHSDHLGQCIPYCLFTDEGRGLRKAPVQIVALETLWNIKTFEACQRMGAWNDETFWAASQHTGSGSSLTSRLLLYVLPHRAYKKKQKQFWFDVLDVVVRDLATLFDSGIDIGGRACIGHGDPLSLSEGALKPDQTGRSGVTYFRDPDKGPVFKAVEDCCCSLLRYFQVLHKNGLWLNRDQCNAAADAVHLFCAGYCFLAGNFLERCLQTSAPVVLSPAAFLCDMSEDFV